MNEKETKNHSAFSMSQFYNRYGTDYECLFNKVDVHPSVIDDTIYISPIIGVSWSLHLNQSFKYSIHICNNERIDGIMTIRYDYLSSTLFYNRR